MKEDILLSICISTYNRASYLQCCLDAIVNQITDDLAVEILVSDNGSEDNTQDIIKIYSEHPNIRFFKQIENIGPGKNTLNLIKEHAKGKFCWIIGDDDYIINGGIRSILKIIDIHNEIDFIYVKVQNFKLNEKPINNEIIDKVNFELIQKFEFLLQPKYSGVFVGELMAGIFRRSLWLGYEKIYEEIEHEYLSTLATTYTHCVIYAHQFVGRKAIYVSTPIVNVDSRAREWWNRVGYVIIEHLFSLLELYNKNGVKGSLLRRCKRHYINISMTYFLKFLFKKNESFGDRINYKRYFLLLLSYPFTTIKVILTLVFDRYFSLSKN